MMTPTMLAAIYQTLDVSSLGKPFPFLRRATCTEFVIPQYFLPQNRQVFVDLQNLRQAGCFALIPASHDGLLTPDAAVFDRDGKFIGMIADPGK